MKIILLALSCLVLTSSCSSFSKIASAETHQASAISKVTLADKKQAKAEQAKDNQIANLTQRVKILLATPTTAQTMPVADQLLDATLTLTGAPTETESSLEKEVAELLQSKAQNDVEMANLNAQNQQIKKDLVSSQLAKDKANQELTKTTTTLYQTALKVASDDDTKSTIMHIMIGTVIFIVLMVCLRIFFTMTKTGATIAAKIP